MCGGGGGGEMKEIPVTEKPTTWDVKYKELCSKGFDELCYADFYVVVIITAHMQYLLVSLWKIYLRLCTIKREDEGGRKN